MRSNRTFPKENQKKLNEIIHELRATLRQKDKEIKFLHDEIENLVKPVRTRLPHVEREKLSHEDWKKDFLKRMRIEVFGEKK